MTTVFFRDNYYLRNGTNIAFLPDYFLDKMKIKHCVLIIGTGADFTAVDVWHLAICDHFQLRQDRGS